MYTFSATVTSSYTISVISNTYWSCKAEGNFKLSKYDGEGNFIIDIIIPDDIMIADGVVTFSFGDERCNYPELTIFLSNLCYVSTNPSYRICNDEKTIFFFYEEAKETFYVSVTCFDGWTVESTNLEYITSNNDVMIISSGKDGELKIIPNHQCNRKNIIHVKLLKKQT
jgi:hypothetical protein